MTTLITMLLAFVLLALAIAAMAVGVMAGRAPIRGSCGGLNGSGCELCSGGNCRAAAEGPRDQHGD
jgi:hypothetical protein